MYKFYINKNQQPSGDYEVHQELICTHPPEQANRIFLGQFAHCRYAIEEAKRKYPNEASKINGCYYCANACHTT